MIEVSQNWINYFKEHDICKMRATLTDVEGNTMSLDETDFMMGSVRLSDSVSTNNAFDVGSVITNTIDCTLNNINKKFDDFNLNDARLSVEFGLEYEGNLFDGMELEYTYLSRISSYGYKSKKIRVLPNETYRIELTYDPFEEGGNRRYWGFYTYKKGASSSYSSRQSVLMESGISTTTFANSLEVDYIEIYISDELPTNLSVSITGVSNEWVSKGTYTLDNPSSLGNTLQCIGYNDIDKLNKPYVGLGIIDNVVTPLNMPRLSDQWVSAISEYCGVSFGSWELQSNILVSNEYVKTNEATTCRDVIGWIIQINGGFARMDEDNALTVRWYSPGTFQDTNTYVNGGGMNPWDTVDSIDGGGMNPWDDTELIDGGHGFLYELEQLSQATISSEDIHVTGVRVSCPNQYENAESILVGEEGYVLQITDNPIVNNDETLGAYGLVPGYCNYKRVANNIYSVVGGYRFKTFDASLYGNPAMEAGDIIGIKDFRGRLWTSYITSLNYTFNGLTEARCEAETITEANSSYGNYGVSIANNAVNAVYEQLNTNKLSADLIGPGTITDPVTAKDFTVDGLLTVKSKTSDSQKGYIQLENDSCVNTVDATSIFFEGSDGVYGFFGGFDNSSSATLLIQGDGISEMNADGTAEFSTSVTSPNFIQSSKVEMKKNLKKADSMLSKIMDSDILSFNFKDEGNVKKHLGLAIGGEYNTPSEVIAVNENGEESGVDLYAMIAMAWKAIQEQQKIIEELQKGVANGNSDTKRN